MKQMIEIDVPDGCEVKEIRIVDPTICEFDSRHCNYKPCLSFGRFIAEVFVVKKEPEFIEVREYFTRDLRGKPIKITLNAKDFDRANCIESDSDFIRWIDKDPRKVEI